MTARNIPAFITLKNIKHAEFASQETNCYSATLYVDGERWGEVSNEGHGGPDNFHGFGDKGWNDIIALNARIGAQVPPTEFYGKMLPATLEGICGDIVAEFLIARDMKRQLAKFTKGKVAFFKGEPSPQNPSIWSVPLRTHTEAAIIAHIKSKHPEAVILNEMPQDKAIAALMATAA